MALGDKGFVAALVGAVEGPLSGVDAHVGLEITRFFELQHACREWAK